MVSALVINFCIITRRNFIQNEIWTSWCEPSVKDLRTGKIDITSQNHGYSIDCDSLKNTDLEVTHIALNDGTVEGLRHKELPAFSVQYHPEARPGPSDSNYLFDEFIAMMKDFKEKERQINA